MSSQHERIYEMYPPYSCVSSTVHCCCLPSIYLRFSSVETSKCSEAAVTAKHGKLQRMFAWASLISPRRAEHPIAFPYFPPSPNTASTPLSTLQLLLLPRLSHCLNSSLSATLSAKCLPRLHLAVVVRAGVVTDVAHQLRPVLRLEITYPSKTLQTLERIILLREQTIPLQRYESTYSPSRPKY